MTHGEAWKKMLSGLRAIYPDQEAAAIAREVFVRMLHLQPDHRVLKAHETMPAQSVDILLQALKELQTGKPVQYITGVCSFLDLELKVEPGVLIPRPETEELVLWVASELEASEQAGTHAILDIGTGSGCIAVSLAKRIPAAAVSACDISPQAIKLANENAKMNRVEIEFFTLDILDVAVARDHFISQRYDCIVSNPPYVRHSEKKWMKPNVLDFEPGLALFVDDSNPLLFYRTIGELAIQSLKPGGMLFFEINEHLAKETSNLLKGQGFLNVEVRSDLSNKPRFIKAQNTSFDFRP